MKIKDLKEEWFQDYKKPSMFIAFPCCTFKCDRECGNKVCQNSVLASEPDIDVDIDEIIATYLINPVSSALVCGGLEPFDSPIELYSLIYAFRNFSDDDVVIYTGYTEDELCGNGMLGDTIVGVFDELRNMSNIIVKFGRFIPNDTVRYDDLLEVTLASSNQYAKIISKGNDGNG